MYPGADITELYKARSLALFRDDRPEVEAVEAKIRAHQSTCSHVAHPDHPERCYLCGLVRVAEPKPGPVKVRRSPLSLRRQA